MVAKLFSGNELSMAMGLILTFGRLGTALASHEFPILYEEHRDHLVFPMLLGSFFCFASAISAFMLVTIDK